MQHPLSAHSRLPSLFLCVLLLPFCWTRSARAQRDPVQFKTQTISVFGGFVYDEIGLLPSSAGGVNFGFDITQHFLRIPLAISLEARANIAYGTQADEHSYVFGPQIKYGFGRFHPYGDFQVGLGNIHFKGPLQLDEGEIGDKSAIVAGGGGLDIDVYRNIAAKIDFQVQRWDIDPIHHTVFVPTLATFGVNYTIPFRAFHRAGDPNYR